MSRESTPCYPEGTPNWPQTTPTLGQIEYPDQPQFGFYTSSFNSAAKPVNSIWPYDDSNLLLHNPSPDTPLNRIAPGKIELSYTIDCNKEVKETRSTVV